MIEGIEMSEYSQRANRNESHTRLIHANTYEPRVAVIMLMLGVCVCYEYVCIGGNRNTYKKKSV